MIRERFTFNVQLGAVKIGVVTGPNHRTCQIRAELLAWQFLGDVFRHVIDKDENKVLRAAVESAARQAFGPVHIVASVGYKTIFCRVERVPQ